MTNDTTCTGDPLRPLNEIAKALPFRRRGKPVHIATLNRWVRFGSRGRKLPAVLVGGAWFARLSDALAFVNGTPSTPTSPPPSPVPTPAAAAAPPAECGMSEAEVDAVLGKVRRPRTAKSAKGGKAGAK